MKTDVLLHYAFRAHDPLKLSQFYADLFEGDYFLHPVMTGVGILMVKLNRPDALFHGLLEFWPWDIIWDGQHARFRKVPASMTTTSYGHMALKVSADTETIVAELQRRGIPFRMEPRGPGLSIPCIDDPEGNMIELFPNIDHMPVPPEFICKRGCAAEMIAKIQQQFAQMNAHVNPDQGYSLLPGQ